MKSRILAVLAVLVGGSYSIPAAETAGAKPAEPPASQPAPPLTYNAISDTKVYPKPELPKLGPAGSRFNDPVFGCPLVRVSDETTAAGSAILTPARGEQNTWNTDSTLFCVHTQDLQNIPYRFDPQTMTPTRINSLPFLLDIRGVAPFSYHEANICYGKDVRRGVIVRFDFATEKASDVLDVAKATGLNAQHLWELTVSANDVLALTFGGSVQDSDPYLLVYDMNHKTQHLWNTKESTIDGQPVANAPKFTQHSSYIDRSGRYVWAVGPGVTGPVIWDVEKGHLLPVTVEKSGHNAMGYGDLVNDVHKWIYRRLTPEGIDHPVDLMAHPAGEPYFGYDSHLSWNNARPDLKVPILLSTYHAEEQGDPKCAWGDEILAVATDGSQKVWRFAHHRSTNYAPSRTGNRETDKHNFWDCPRGNVSQDGRFYMFTSNWEETLGKGPQGRSREDVFIVKLERSGLPPAANVPAPAPAK